MAKMKVCTVYNEEQSYQLIRLAEKLHLTPKQMVTQIVTQALQEMFNSEIPNPIKTEWERFKAEQAALEVRKAEAARRGNLL